MTLAIILAAAIVTENLIYRGVIRPDLWVGRYTRRPRS